MMMMVMKPQALCTALALVRHEQLYVILAFRSTTISGRSTFTMDYGQDELAYLDNIRISILPPSTLLLSSPLHPPLTMLYDCLTIGLLSIDLSKLPTSLLPPSLPPLLLAFSQVSSCSTPKRSPVPPSPHTWTLTRCNLVNSCTTLCRISIPKTQCVRFMVCALPLPLLPFPPSFLFALFLSIAGFSWMVSQSQSQLRVELSPAGYILVI